MNASLKHGVNVSGDDYVRLIDWCFRHATYFRLSHFKEYRTDDRNPTTPESVKTILSELESYLMLKREHTLYPTFYECVDEGCYYSIPDEYYYKCCEETKRYLLETSNSIYDWCVDKPENLCFYDLYRSEVLYTIVHETICWISCPPEEFKDFPVTDAWDVDPHYDMCSDEDNQ